MAILASLAQLTEQISNIPPVQLAIIVVTVLFASSYLYDKHPRVAGAKYYGYKSWWEPSLLLRMRFFTTGKQMIDDAYDKFKNVPFVLRRHDTDLTIMPMRYIEEIRVMPREDISLWKAQLSNVVPKWTYTHVLLDTNLHIRGMNNKLIPELADYLLIASEELKYAWNIDIPACDEWTTLDIQSATRSLISRMTARIFMGKLAARDPEWLQTSLHYAHDLWGAAFALRMLPVWMHPVAAQLLPARRRLSKQLASARRLVRSLTTEHFEALKNDEDPENTILGWMLDHATKDEQNIDIMAGLQCILGMLGIHSVANTLNNLIFDLCVHPEWVPVLREEMLSVIAEHGKLGESKMPYTLWLSKLAKMDSFIMETQRHNPQILLNPQRTAMRDITLSDGTKIPKGTRFAFPGHQHAMDPEINENPEQFDPMRAYRKRQLSEENYNRFHAAQPNSTAMTFGYGTQACPGRYFSIAEIKMIMLNLLLEYDFKLPPGKERPPMLCADEMVFLAPDADMLIKKR